MPGKSSQFRFLSLPTSILTGAMLLSATAAGAQPDGAVPEPPAVDVAPPETALGSDLAAVLEAISTPGVKLDASRFNASFLAQVPEPQLHAVLEQLQGQVGSLELVSVEAGADGDRLVAVCRAERGGQFWRISIDHDDEGKIGGLLLRPAPELAVPALAGWADLDARLEGMGGEVSFGAYELLDGDGAAALGPVHTLNAARAQAIGSTFKLWVLGALAEKVGTGEARWDEALAVCEAFKSLPGGQMQNDPAGTEHPVSHFAREMIRISDNTATDHLLHFVGREEVASYMARFCAEPDRNRPFLSTRDMFVLKLGGDAELPERFVAAGEQAQREMVRADGLVTIGAPNLLLAAAWRKPFMIDRIEWFASAEECCRTMADLRRLAAEPGLEPVRAALSANPGLPLDEEVWSGFFYKGGSEPGVLNLTWLLERRDGRTFIVSVGFNNPERAIDEDEALALTGAVLKLLGRTP